MRSRLLERTPRVAAAALWWLIAAGCGHNEGGATVQGTITYQGAPVPQGSISFIPKGGPTATAQIQSDGTYKLLDPHKSEWIQPGSYDVVIMAVDDPVARTGDESAGTKLTVLVPRDVLRQATTPLRYDVVEGANTIDINLDELPSKAAGAGS